MVSTIRSLGLAGITGYEVNVECFLSGGLTAFDVVGLPDAAVREARERVRATCRSCGFQFPSGRITVNLAPADTRKEGSVYDLPLLLSILAAGEQIPPPPADAAFIGELSLDGQLRPVRGVLPMADGASARGITALYCPADNAAEASLAQGLTVYPVRSLAGLLAHLREQKSITPAPVWEPSADPAAGGPDFSDVLGQYGAKRAMEVAAAGGHNILLVGPPGAGKSMLAERIGSILPSMSRREALEATKIHSVAGLTSAARPMLAARPFRAPHHTTSAAGLSGGGRTPRPGEISLAHHGVLFLDELPEFASDALEILRQPMETGRITLSRVAGTMSYPARFLLVAAMNPCKCGNYGHPTLPCRCTPEARARYRAKISGPLLDRIDLHISLPPVAFEALHEAAPQENSAQVRARVEAARALQRRRLAGTGCECNADIPPGLLRQICVPDGAGKAFLESVFNRLSLTARSHDRILRLSRTIADLQGDEALTQAHLAEALRFRT